MSIKKVFVSSDTTDLKNASRSTADAILANVTTKVHLNADQGATMKDSNEEVFTSSSKAAAVTHPSSVQVGYQDRSDFEQLWHKGGDAKSTVVHPTQKITDFSPQYDEAHLVVSQFALARHPVPQQQEE